MCLVESDGHQLQSIQRVLIAESSWRCIVSDRVARPLCGQPQASLDMWNQLTLMYGGFDLPVSMSFITSFAEKNANVFG